MKEGDQVVVKEKLELNLAAPKVDYSAALEGQQNFHMTLANES